MWRRCRSTAQPRILVTFGDKNFPTMSTGRTKFLDPKNDFAFKRIFGREQNRDILKAFLNDMLDHEHIGQIASVELLPTIQNPEAVSKKESILDVLCEDQNGVRYIVEMQIASTDHFLKRAHYYAAQAYGRQLRGGEDYANLKEVIFLAIVDFKLFPNKKAIKSDHIVLDKVTGEHDLRDFYFTFVELPKFTKSIDELQTNTEYWYYYLKHAPETVGEVYEKILDTAPPIFKRAYQELDKSYWSTAELNTYDSVMKNLLDEKSRLKFQYKQGRKKGKEEGKKEGKKEGIAIGEERGKKAGKKEIALEMLQDGASLEKIQKWTGLSKRALERIKADFMP